MLRRLPQRMLELLDRVVLGAAWLHRCTAMQCGRLDPIPKSPALSPQGGLVRLASRVADHFGGKLVAFWTFIDLNTDGRLLRTVCGLHAVLNHIHVAANAVRRYPA